MRANLLFRESIAGASAGSPVGATLPMDVPAATAPRKPAAQSGLLERIDDWFWQLRQRDVNAYLARSQNVYELEQRMRDLERMTPHPYY